jgi:CBS-domain-containing membrane protein
MPSASRASASADKGETMNRMNFIKARILQDGRSIIAAGIGGFALICLLARLGENLNQPLVLGSFGATCVLVFGFPDLPFSRPRNVILGHVLTSFIGLACLTLLDTTPWSMALAVAMGIMAMMATKTVHPPAGSNPVIIFSTHPSWSFLLAPTLAGAVLIIWFGLLYNRLARRTSLSR